MSAKEQSLKDIEWERLKSDGSQHYHGSEIQPIDLYKANGHFRSWALLEICQHALRNLDADKPINERDMDKVIHYAKLLKVM